jgi:hypothetical protein
MGYLRFLWAGWSALSAVWQKMKDLDAAGVARLSDQWWLELRKWTEVKTLSLVKRQDKGVLKLFKSDNAFFHGVLVYLKSDHLAAVETAAGLTAKNAAERALLAKATVPKPRMGDPGTGGVHQI